MADDALSVRMVRWSEAQPQLRAVRETVFVREQGVPVELEWDGLDPACAHALATAGGEAIGTARLAPGGHVGRMAVVKAWRGRGVGRALLELLLREARSSGLDRVDLNAQTYAQGFYARFGFRAEGPEFLDAGIPHVRMTLRI
jgi:predicted GNAT family N-acyltransferase